MGGARCATDRWARGRRRRACARPSRVRADANPAQKWAGNGSPADEKRTRVRLGRRVGPTFLSAPTQTDGGGRNGSPHWSCSYFLHRERRGLMSYLTLHAVTQVWAGNLLLGFASRLGRSRPSAEETAWPVVVAAGGARVAGTVTSPPPRDTAYPQAGAFGKWCWSSVTISHVASSSGWSVQRTRTCDVLVPPR